MSLPAILIYSFGTLPTSALGVAILVYLSPYFASHLGVPLTVVAAAFFIVRWIDFFVDPMLGMIMDRTRTRVRAVPGPGSSSARRSRCSAVYRLFPDPARDRPDPTWSCWLLVLLYLGSSALDLSRSAWAATLSSQYDERSRIFGILSAVGVLGNVAILVIPIIAPRFAREPAPSPRADDGLVHRWP